MNNLKLKKDVINLISSNNFTLSEIITESLLDDAFQNIQSEVQNIGSSITDELLLERLLERISEKDKVYLRFKTQDFLPTSTKLDPQLVNILNIDIQTFITNNIENIINNDASINEAIKEAPQAEDNFKKIEICLKIIESFLGLFPPAKTALEIVKNTLNLFKK